MTRFLDEVEETIPALRRYARALTRNSDRADDLVQDCLERAIRKSQLFRPTGSLKAWLFRVLLNIYRNDLRHQKIVRFEALDGLVVEPVSAATQPGRLALAEVARAMDRLPEDQREALLLVVLEGCSYAEAAGILDIPPGTLMSRLGRAREALRRMTEGLEEVKLRNMK